MSGHFKHVVEEEGCHRKCSTLHNEHGRVAEVIREELRVDCGGHEDDTDVGTKGEDVSEEDEEEVSWLATFMYFVDDNVRHVLECDQHTGDKRGGRQGPVLLIRGFERLLLSDLSRRQTRRRQPLVSESTEEDAHRAELNGGSSGRRGLVTYSVTNDVTTATATATRVGRSGCGVVLVRCLLATAGIVSTVVVSLIFCTVLGSSACDLVHTHTALLGYSSSECNGGQPPRLRDYDSRSFTFGFSMLIEKLRDLRRLAGARGA